MSLVDMADEAFRRRVRDKGNIAIRDASGRVDINSKLVAFLYLLGRDYMPLGQVQELMGKLCDPNTGLVEPDNQYCNGWLAQWAQHIADQIRDPEPPPEPVDVVDDPEYKLAGTHTPDRSRVLTSDPPQYYCSNPDCYSHPTSWEGWTS